MAIQMRRGLLANYDEDKMVAGELAVTTDSTDEDQKVYVAFAPGVSKRILTETDYDSISESAAAAAEAAAERAEAAVEELSDIAAEIYVDGTALVINTGLADGNEVSY